MDPSIRLAADRVKAWHLARFLAHVEPPEPTMPPPPPAQPERAEPITDPVHPGQPRTDEQMQQALAAMPTPRLKS